MVWIWDSGIKKGMLYSLLVVVFLMGTISCSSQISTRGSQVYLLTAAQVHKVETECEYIGHVVGKSWYSYETALNTLMDNAAELGATHLFVNIGRKHYLRGEAYVCAYCKGKDGMPDVGVCVDEQGLPDQGYCRDEDGNIVGQAQCKKAAGKTRQECLENCGTWDPSYTRQECDELGYTWVPPAENRQECLKKNKTWLPPAEDQYTCEEVKGGEWVIDTDVIRILKEQEGGEE